MLLVVIKFIKLLKDFHFFKPLKNGWDIWARTKNARIKILSVTITLYPKMADGVGFEPTNRFHGC